MPSPVTSSGGITWDLAVRRGEKYLEMHPNMNYITGDYACVPFAHYVMTGRDLRYSQIKPMLRTKPLVNRVNPNSWYVVAWTHSNPEVAGHVGVLHGGRVIHRAEGFPMVMPFNDLNASLTNLGYDQIPGYSPIYYNWGN
jgi:hypothetical protein